MGRNYNKTNNENVERYFNKIELTRENLMKNFDDIKYKPPM